MFNEIKQFIDAQGWNYQIMTKENGRRVFKMQLNSHNCSMGYIIDVRTDTVLILALCQINTLPQKRPAMAELLTRINHKLLLGNFEMNYDNGEIRYNLSWRYHAAEPVSDTVIEHNVVTCAASFDRFLPAIMRVNYSNIAPAAALKEVEEDAPSWLN